MTKIEELTIGVQNAGFSGYLSGEQVTTYTQLLEAVELLYWVTRCSTADVAGCRATFIAEEKIVRMKWLMEKITWMN